MKHSQITPPSSGNASVIKFFPKGKSLIEKVVEGGFCIGCGACTFVDSRITIQENTYGDLVAHIPTEVAGDPLNASEVCPFATAKDETQIASQVFLNASQKSRIAGWFEAVYKGYSNDYREFGSSGGIGTHILARYLLSQKIDGVICVGPSDEQLVQFQVVTGADELLACSTSFYYPVTLASALQFVKEKPGRYAFTGVPCFHKALRLLKEQDMVLRERIVLQVGLVCGQMKSSHYADYMARRTGMPEGAELRRISFRSKKNTLRADDYNFVANWTLADGGEGSGTLPAHAIGFHWGMSYFKPKACDYCDDVYAECADISIMDAWLPGDVEDARGTSIVIARSKEMSAFLDKEAQDERLSFSSCTLTQVIQSQEGGLRHRRQGLRFRLWLENLQGGWIPRKRVAKKFNVGFFVGTEMIFRLLLRAISRGAYKLQRRSNTGLNVFKGIMLGPEFGYKVFSKVRRVCEKRMGKKSTQRVFEIDS